MKLRNKILTLVSFCTLITNLGTNHTYSGEFFKKIQNAANTCFKAIKYTGYTLAVGSGAWSAFRFKNTGMSSSIKPLVLTFALAGVGYLGKKGEKWTEEKEKEKINDQKKGNENEILHSDSGLQSK